MAKGKRAVKPQIRTLGIDDSRFRFKEGRAYLVAVQMRGHDVIENTRTEMVDVDGWDATDAVIRLVLGAPAFLRREYVTVEGRRPEPLEKGAEEHMGLHAVLIDGLTVAGFNVIDVERVYEATRVPILAVTTRNPDLGRIHRALEHNFEDWPERFKIFERNRVTSVRVGTNTLHGHIAGIHPLKAQEILLAVTKPGHRVPEPIRVADSFASSMPTDSPPEIADAEIAPQPAAIDGTPITQEAARVLLVAAYKAKMRDKLASAAPAAPPRPAVSAPASAPAAAKPAAPPAAAAAPAAPAAAKPPAPPATATSTPAAAPAAAAVKPAAPPAPGGAKPAVPASPAAAAKPGAPAGAPAAAAVKPAAPPAPRKKEEARIDWDKAIAAATWRPAAKIAAAKREVGPIGRFDADIPTKKGHNAGNVEYLGGPDDAEVKKAD
jgi:endonuclease V-like protein UPF0215 family